MYLRSFILILVLIVPIIAAVSFADLLSRLWRRRVLRPGWTAGILAIIAAALASSTVWFICLYFRFEAIVPGFWSGHGKIYARGMLEMITMLTFFIVTLPAALVVEFHQRAFDRDAVKRAGIGNAENPS